ncbi:endo alpha-1,4 polygalactosaminidase [Tenacibaculum maritimum]|uniref:endo alpha-1,4 polygalactosaminidase n=1 Tax=Tenacibaculum maritimum TaxID=107401 RepID=UPI0012E671E4|nr:endo alpha-1,4 polygalactosaminidase [Tenacibaculum maritimum]CAA0147866.1 Endo-alpha-1,4-polygalactosaminidase, family GH114 [Tenacibaculum maritimum]CAA0197546.1 Endo-alpha-1,4-polygalactosaminidase, family GH114 [Tenacibaculum maritimum]CAA0202264.1 Endo-alpha-1,4-polygalactosaminidase, family GH114 [Tenacibaculum maritimum]CAA0227019.1 Endo-alpha-1,4-polygalactosaminidase, family GH114 [Tenacibaculum maritimum]CAA0235962.1 Endo-alpha-1,4-polygalactosaminidase, family GH114 [Tenacibaculu
MKKYLFLFLTNALLFISCSKESQSRASSRAITVFNQAYQENYEKDKIPEILVRARNAYVLIDPFQENIAQSVADIKAHNNKVGAYISIGTGEIFRADFSKIKPFLVKKAWSRWNQEYFVNSTTTGILDIMKARIDQIASWGCDWVEFDNMDWFADKKLKEEYGFQVTEEEGIAYFQALCDYVHKKGMKCMAKNTVKNAENFDGVLYESHNYNKNWWIESDALEFLKQGKLVIVNHYNEPDCGEAYLEYTNIYSPNLSFICEDANLQRYVHY